MAFLGQEFDANEVDPSSPIEILPAGEYRAHIVKSEVSDTKNNGKQLVLEFEILDGEFAKRRFWDRLNIVNTGEKAQQVMEIAYRTLSAICHATGVLKKISDSDELHFKPLIAVIEVHPDSRDKDKPADQQRLQNAVKGYKKPDGSELPKKAANSGGGNSGGAAAAVSAGEKGAANAKPVPSWRRNRAA